MRQVVDNRLPDFLLLLSEYMKLKSDKNYGVICHYAIIIEYMFVLFFGGASTLSHPPPSSTTPTHHQKYDRIER